MLINEIEILNNLSVSNNIEQSKILPHIDTCEEDIFRKLFSYSFYEKMINDLTIPASEQVDEWSYQDEYVLDKKVIHYGFFYKLTVATSIREEPDQNIGIWQKINKFQSAFYNTFWNKYLAKYISNYVMFHSIEFIHNQVMSGGIMNVNDSKLGLKTSDYKSLSSMKAQFQINYQMIYDNMSAWVNDSENVSNFDSSFNIIKSTNCETNQDINNEKRRGTRFFFGY